MKFISLKLYSVLSVFIIASLLLLLLIEYRRETLDANIFRSSGKVAANSECIRPKYSTREYFNYDVEVDNDRDRMDDDWEILYNLDPGNANDASQDADLDGFSNLQEFEGNTNPRLSELYPGIIVVPSPGFDCFYTAEAGFINDDELLDILIQDPSKGYLPDIRGFVLVQQSDHSFVIEDASHFDIPALDIISSSIVLAEINADGATDLVLTNLSEHIPGVSDQIVFAPVSDIKILGSLGSLPHNHVELTREAISFFYDLHEWIKSLEWDYFEENAPVVATVPGIEELSWVAEVNVSSQGGVPSPQRLGSDNECMAPRIRCFNVVVDASDPEDSPPTDELVVEYTSEVFELLISDLNNDPDIPDVLYQVQASFSDELTIDIKDYSAFNQDALKLAQNEFRTILESGVMFDPSRESEEVFRVLSKYLGHSPLAYGARTISDWRTYQPIPEYVTDSELVFAIQSVIVFIAERYVKYPEN